MRQRHLYANALILAAVGSGVFLYKAMVLGFPIEAGAESEVWTVQVRIRFAAAGGPTKVVLQVPHRPPGFTIVDENFISRGFGMVTSQEAEGREAQWAKRRAVGLQSLYYRAVFHPERDAEPRPAPRPVAAPELEEPHQTALLAVVDEVREQSADTLSFVAEILKRVNDPSPSQYIQLFLTPDGTLAERVEVALTFLRGAKIPAQVAYGLMLEDGQRRATLRPWLEVYDGRRWLYFNPATGQPGLPASFLIWWRGDRPLVSVVGGDEPEVVFSTQRSAVQAMDIVERRAERLGSRLLEFSLLGLPLQTQAVYRILLLVPIGAFIMVLLRNVVGVQTFGTFLPVLVALSFRETRLLWGIVLFSLLMALGLSVRFYLERLRLLLVPRLAAVLMVVVLLMVGVSILFHRLGLESGLSVALFPMVILTIAIEHMSIVWEERGAGEALTQGVGTLAVAALAYLVMNLRSLQHLAFLFPELLLVLLAATLLLGRYSGYRLLELRRFRTFGGAEP